MSDLAIEDLRFRNGSVAFTVAHQGAMDASDWLAAGASEIFSVPLALPPGAHRIEVIADPEGQILEEAAYQLNNRASLEIELP